jgi:hypothetical protein
MNLLGDVLKLYLNHGLSSKTNTEVIFTTYLGFLSPAMLAHKINQSSVGLIYSFAM